MTPTERDKNRYAIMEEAREAYGRLLGDETGAPYAHLALTFGINRIAHDIRLHLNDEDLSAEEARALAILAIAEKSLLPTRALLDAVTFYLDLGSNDRKNPTPDCSTNMSARTSFASLAGITSFFPSTILHEGVSLLAAWISRVVSLTIKISSK